MVWDIHDPSALAERYRQSFGARAVALNPNGITVAAARQEGLYVESLDQLEETRRVHPFDGVTAVAFNSKGNLLAAGGSEGLKVWNSYTFEEIRSTMPPGEILAVGFTGLGRCVVLASSGESALIWDATEEVPMSNFLHGYQVEAAVLSSDARLAATATSAGDLWIWEADDAWQRPVGRPKPTNRKKNIFRRFVDVFRGGKKNRGPKDASERQAEQGR
jgi:WD40 repeat protein